MWNAKFIFRSVNFHEAGCTHMGIIKRDSNCVFMLLKKYISINTGESLCFGTTVYDYFVTRY